MGALNTEQSNVEAVTALTNAPTIRKLLRVPDEDGKTNFEILKVQAIKELANGHNCEVTLRVDLAFGHEGLPVPENERYSVRTETVRRIDLKDVAEFAELELNDKQQYIGAGSTVEAVATLLGAALTEDDITVSPIKDVFWVRAKDNSVGYTGQLTIAGEAAPVIKVPTSITATLSAADVNIDSAVTYTVDLLPADANDRTYTVTADKPALVTIDTTAKTVTGKAAGVVKLTFQSVAAPTVKVEKTLNVKPLPVVKPTGVSITSTKTTLIVGETNAPTITVVPADAVDKTTTIVSDNPAVVVIENNAPKAVSPGTANIKAVSNAVPSLESEPLEYTVTLPPLTELAFTSETSVSHIEGSVTHNLTVVGTPENASVEGLVFTVVESSDGVEAEIAGNQLTVVGATGGSTIKVKAIVGAVTAEQTITISGEM